MPNILSLIRLGCMPVLLWLAYTGHPYWFLAVLTLAFITDALDGYIARRFNQVTALGAKLDSWADVSIYMSLSISVFWLWPDISAAEKLYILLVVNSILVPVIIGLLKFGALTSYHTWFVKFAAACTAISSIMLFAGGPALPFRIASILCIIGATEQILISLYLTAPKSNVKTLWHVIHNHRRPPKNLRNP